MINLRNDYASIAHPKILNKMVELQNNTFVGYGLDEISDAAKLIIQKEVGQPNAEVCFLVGGTITNKVLISHILKPYEAVVSVESGHINVHETGTIEQGGHKIITVPHHLGKMKVADLKRAVMMHTDEHMVKPKLVYITQATEYGTLYTKQELQEISEYCKEHNLYLFVDGARLGVALTTEHTDLTIKDLAVMTDAFYIGGTKCGALLGEALVIMNEEMKHEIRYSIKHFGGMYAKGFVAGIQFKTLFEDGLYYQIARCQNDLASNLTKGLKELGVKFLMETETNQIFPIFSNEIIKKLEKHLMFELWEKGENESTIRFVCHYLLTESDIKKALEIIQEQL